MTVLEAMKAIRVNRKVKWISFIDNDFEQRPADITSEQFEVSLNRQYSGNRTYGFLNFTIIYNSCDVMRTDLKMANELNLDAIFKNVEAIYRKYSLHMSPFNYRQDIANTEGFKAYYDTDKEIFVLEAGEEQYV